MTVENWIELLVPIIGIVVAAVSAGLTYYLLRNNKLQQTKAASKRNTI